MHRQHSGLLAAWSTAWLSGHASYDDVIDAVVADARHRVTGLPGLCQPVPLGWALTALREHGETRMALVLPVPGDPRGLPRPGEFSAAALDTGEAVVGEHLGLVPDRSDGEEVAWTAYPVAPAAPDPVGLAEAEHELADQLRVCARALSDLDVARWRPEVTELLHGLRHQQARIALPANHSPRALGLLERAERLMAVLDLAMADAPGGAVTGYDARARDAALRPLATAVRRALVAGYNAT